MYLGQRFSTGAPQGFLKLAIPDYLVRGTDLFPLDCQMGKKMTMANTVIAGKKYIFFCQISKKKIFLVCCRILVISLCVP